MTDRTAIMQRVLNLRELADSSSSEAEALNAMKIAAKMMAAYRIEEAELALEEGLGNIRVEIVDEIRYDVGLNVGRVRHKVQNVIWALEQYCEVECVLKSSYTAGGWDGNKKHGIHIIGDKPDVELFWFLLELCRDAMDREYARWLRTQQGVGRGAKASFQLAMGSRLRQRLEEMTRKRDTDRREAEAAEAVLLNKPVEDVRMAVSNGDIKMLSSNMALVVVAAAEQKRKAVTEAYAAAYKGVKLGTASGFGYASNRSAASAGASAANRVSFGRPVGGSASKRLN